MIKLVGTKDFINRLTKNQLSPKQLNKAAAYLRAKKLCFYDDWSKEHNSVLKTLETNKIEVINALKVTLKIKQ